ncbi:hypothetical protein [Streptomyces sp. CBMAI 2042]|uniref:hypothetical protein n=1 Tax=Streptomyces sp. CBMAI 2042 TaxID=2305222 RepID=UPI001F4437D2|nr:hypothetical protein [Streptomyces sp. CBMAI 2042]
MTETNERWDIPKDRWVFGLEEIPAYDRGEDGTSHRVAPAFNPTVISAPEGTPQALCWAAEEIVSQCGLGSIVDPPGVAQDRGWR